jgi:RimJ/RimL family protein N-acetyltransferase
MKYNLKLKEVDEKDVQFLYNLLDERKPVTYISHKKMPTYEEHVNFVKSSPYSKWYIIEVDGERSGSIYLTKQNEIGIFLNEGLQEKGIGSNALNVLIGKNPDLRYLANINPENKKSIKFFKKLGFTLIQYTYELNK